MTLGVSAVLGDSALQQPRHEGMEIFDHPEGGVEGLVPDLSEKTYRCYDV